MICPKCGKENDNFQTVCLYCGEPLTPGFIMCPECGKVLREGDAICPRCRAKIYKSNESFEERRKNSTRTPMFVAKVPLSLIISILLLIPAIFFLVVYIITMVNGRGFITTIIGVGLGTAVALLTFIYRLFVNTIKNVDKLENRVSAVKALIVADVVQSVLVFIFAILPVYLKSGGPGIVDITIVSVYGVCFILSVIMLPFFLSGARVRSR